MTFRTAIQTVAGKICSTLIVLVVPYTPPLVIFAYKYGPNVRLEQWLLWVLLDIAFLIGAMQGLNVVEVWKSITQMSVSSLKLQIGVQTAIMYILCVVLAIFIVWESSVLVIKDKPNSNSQAQGGMAGGGDPYSGGDGMYNALSKYRRRASVDEHFKRVASARAQAASQLKRDVNEKY
ncbi:uncharacterized protein JCM15063_001350 [Sporobolomyces koalae]|uniref:uncharacterized protein n=1 Tax=Sporobolomyces koalae TaxID=500713 RepID=UPI00317EA1BB